MPRSVLSDAFDELPDWNTPAATKLRALLDASAERPEPHAWVVISPDGKEWSELQASICAAKDLAHDMDCELPASHAGGKHEIREVYFSAPAAQPQGVPVAWVECSPAWLKAGGDCANAPRLCVGRDGISHLHPAHAKQPAPVAQKYDDTLLPFLAMMRKELHANSHKGDREGWLGMTLLTAMNELTHHHNKLGEAVEAVDAPQIAEYASDVANCAMMLADVCGVLGRA